MKYVATRELRNRPGAFQELVDDGDVVLPGRILDLAVRGDLIVLYDDRILAEYREVLGRPNFTFAAPLSVTLEDEDDLPLDARGRPQQSFRRALREMPLRLA